MIWDDASKPYANLGWQGEGIPLGIG
jgi:hypothetical protein